MFPEKKSWRTQDSGHFHLKKIDPKKFYMVKKVRDVDWNQVIYRLTEIDKSKILERDTLCYIANLGGMSNSTFIKIKGRNDVEIISRKKSHFDFFWHKIFGFFSSRYWTIGKLIDPSSIEIVFDLFTEQSMAELYVLSKKDEAKFVDFVSKSDSVLELSKFVKTFSSFFIYGVDTDNIESKTGIVEIISYGKDCSKSLIDIVEMN